ncbi:MAG: prolipoprotein diacylglyceryl transferase [Actinobacteria bacterium]|nr:prolipoprotein diacylglyceryl transferase [Actinomycetota bacterium]
MNIDPIAFTVFNLEIRWYGILTALALVIGFVVAYFIARYRGQKEDEVLNLAPFAIIFAIISARLLHVLVNWAYYSQHMSYIFAFRKGGLAIQGAMIGGILALIVFCKIRKLDFWLWGDIMTPGLILGQAIGRWGNFFNQEAFGRPTSVPWAIFIKPENRPFDYSSYEYFHPTFLYESIANLALFILLLLMHRFYRNKPDRFPYGLILSMYLGVYAVYRTFIEAFRIDSTFFGPVKVVYIINMIGVIAALVIASHVTRRFREKKIRQQNIGE